MLFISDRSQRQKAFCVIIREPFLECLNVCCDFGTHEPAIRPLLFTGNCIIANAERDLKRNLCAAVMVFSK